MCSLGPHILYITRLAIFMLSFSLELKKVPTRSSWLSALVSHVSSASGVLLELLAVYRSYCNHLLSRSFLLSRSTHHILWRPTHFLWIIKILVVQEVNFSRVLPRQKLGAVWFLFGTQDIFILIVRQMIWIPRHHHTSHPLLLSQQIQLASLIGKRYERPTPHTHGHTHAKKAPPPLSGKNPTFLSGPQARVTKKWKTTRLSVCVLCMSPAIYWK